MIKSRNLTLSAVLLATVSLSWWLVQNSFEEGPESHTLNSPSTPNEFMTQAYYTRFDETGEVQSKLYSPKIVHYRENDRTLLDTPELMTHTQDNQTWIITAQHGISEHGAKEIKLKENVKIKRIRMPQNTTSTLTTADLTAYPDTGIAKTDQPVVIVQPGSIIKSTGMTANLKTGDINLLSKAQGIFENNNARS